MRSSHSNKNHEAEPVLESLPDLEGVVMITGSFGSGKTEVSVNLALQLAALGRQVHLVDLDIVNPYFRSREAQRLLEAGGVRVVVPAGALAYADLPIVLPEIAGLCRARPGRTHLFDVGGDDLGARALAALQGHIAGGPYEMLMVINARRPFTSTVEGCLAMQVQIEEAARLKVTGLLVNTHLMTETTPEIVLDGRRLAEEVSARSGLPIRLTAIAAELAAAPELGRLDGPVLWLKRRMLPPWLVEKDELGPAPAKRPTPVGVPRYQNIQQQTAASRSTESLLTDSAPEFDRGVPDTE
ncbi:MAG: cobalamin biosynthesis protein CbiA [Acidobacteriota bacterium]|nr:cobalamin biosynthesis protein CbiA [Acidobacteriota bacterium]